MLMNSNHPHIPYKKELVEKARANRKNPTAAEKKMWYNRDSVYEQ